MKPTRDFRAEWRLRHGNGRGATLMLSMVPLRRWLAPFAAIWLVCQLAGLLAAPVVLGFRATAADAEEAGCECPGTAPGQACPMHKGHADTRDDENTCRMQSTCATSDAALLTICGSIGLLPAGAAVEAHHVPETIVQPIRTLTSRTELPDAPPPRA
jgi:hypothetical protein